MKKKFPIILLLSCSLLQLFAIDNYFFYIQLRDKNHSPYSLEQPEKYLSEKSIERRNFFSIETDSLDIPITPIYLREIEKVGVKVHSVSKWLNGVTVQTADSSLVSNLKSLKFVDFVDYTGKISSKNDAYKIVGKYKSEDLMPLKSDSQIRQLNGQVLAENGYLGKDITIAVIDAGFYNVDKNRAFEKLRNSGRLLGIKDFVDSESNIYSENSHGANVLSIMVGEIDDEYSGSAPSSSYWLIRTEVVEVEYPLEPDLWVSAIEFSDSVGVDVATTSLGYSTFDDSSMNYTHRMLDGKSTRASIAASIAAQKGMLLLVAAGNDGNKPWRKIGVPSDAEGVIAVGAVGSDSIPASFSSFGTDIGGFSKPELSARGLWMDYVGTDGKTRKGSGTSYATPLLAGLMASYLEAAKKSDTKFTLNELKNNVYSTANLYPNHDKQLGYGVPNFKKAMEKLKSNTAVRTFREARFVISYTEKTQLLTIRVLDDVLKKRDYSILDIYGREVIRGKIYNEFENINLSNFNVGVYIVKIAGCNAYKLLIR